MSIKLRESTDNIKYKTLKAPAEVELETVSVAENKEISKKGAFPVYHIYVKCSEIKEKLLPLDANPREPRTTKQVKQMKNELRENPSSFVKKNNGLTVLASNVNQKDDNIKLSFNSKQEGVCNGGHTYFSILTTEFELDDDALAHLEVIEIPELNEKYQEIVEIARARNNNKGLQKKSEADFLGYYDDFKEMLYDEELVSWHEGDSDAKDYAIDAPHLIRMCYSLDPTTFQHSAYGSDGNKSHKAAAKGRTKYHNKWFKYKAKHDKDDLKHILPLLEDILYLRDYLAHSIYVDGDFWDGFRRTSLYQTYLTGRSEDKKKKRNLHMRDLDEERGVDYPSTLEVMLMGLFRSNVFLYRNPTGEITYVGWIKEPTKLWNNRKSDILHSWSEYFQDTDGDPSVFIRRSAPYEKEIFKLGTDQEIPNPEILYSVKDGTKYERNEEGNYVLDIEEGRGMMENYAEVEDMPIYEQE